MNVANNYGSQMQALGNAPEQQPERHIENVISRLAELTIGIRGIDEQLQLVHDRAFGPSPPDGKNGSAAREVRCGAHGMLNDRIDDIDGAMARIREKVERLSAFV